MKLLKVEIQTDGGPFATHNYPCPVLGDKPAVLDLSKGVFQPSWQAQMIGWKLVKADTLLKAWVLKLFF